MGETSFKVIRYADVQIKLQAYPVFSALKVNSILAHLSPIAGSQEHLIRADNTHNSTLSFLQRDALVQTVRGLCSKHPSLDIKTAFSGPDSQVKLLSDDLLQYSCRCRAGILELKLNAFLPS